MNPQTWTSAVSRARTHISSITSYTVQDDTLVGQIINQRSQASYEEVRRLAMVGDMALRTAIVSDWWPTGKPVQKASALMFNIASNQRLAHIGRQQSLGSIIVSNTTGPKVAWANVKKAETIAMATTVEAVLGAVWLDSGTEIAAVSKAVAALGLDVPGNMPPKIEKLRGKERRAAKRAAAAKGEEIRVEDSTFSAEGWNDGWNDADSASDGDGNVRPGVQAAPE